ncbi:MAG: MBL fold metallo-hydrolase [Ardenticatenales bacterium]|nr:MBL fold metallo-hydrolase [Ardenticatenales bacterium]
MIRDTLHLITLPLGEWNTNCYLLVAGGESIIIDPAAEEERILAGVEGTAVKTILLTHAHRDHVLALDKVRRATGAPLGIHPSDSAAFEIVGDFEIIDGDVVPLGEGQLIVAHTPGHTPGSVCFRFDRRAIVGDTLFPGGPGHSTTPRALAQLLSTLREKVFAWPDETAFYPGHGAGSTIGAVRPAFETFMTRPRPAHFCGHVEWV